MSLRLSLFASLSVLVAFSLPGAVAAKDKTVIAGTASVSDGDTLKFDGFRVGLWGIDAPERGQTCGKTDAGALAENALRTLANGKRTVCEVRDYDSKTKRPIATCTVDGEDLAASLVEQGWAYPRNSQNAYGVEQSRAKASMKGVNILSCDSPSKWRRDTERAELKKKKKADEKRKKLASRE
ncbi:MAG: thermonuclease family protein [Caulobacterales bacterium]